MFEMQWQQILGKLCRPPNYKAAKKNILYD
jgi:hypothetical protein